ncbi:MAG: PHP domain-containing protein [Gammaproteobacteria bacterium]|nr:PHP domain-containing protein [Gammaproteobacteria bacterium]
MSLHYDLHSHSIISDGSLSPSELVRHAHQSGVDVLALTDHDTTDGLAEAGLEAARVGISLINGVEISVSWNKYTIHIVGLLAQVDNEILQQGLSGLREFRIWRAQEIAKRLHKAGIPDAYEGAQVYATGSIIGRVHFAKFLIEKEYARDMREVFKRFLVHNKPGYVNGQWASLEDTLRWIKAAGGIAVVAHPARYRFTATKLKLLLGEFKELGGVAMEVVSGNPTRDEIEHMSKRAQTQHLLASRGSDYHGPENAWLKMGRLQTIPASCQPVWEHEVWSSLLPAVIQQPAVVL